MNKEEKLYDILHMVFRDCPEGEISMETISIVLLRIYYGYTVWNRTELSKTLDKAPTTMASERLVRYCHEEDTRLLIDAIRYLLEELRSRIKEDGEDCLPYPYKGVF